MNQVFQSIKNFVLKHPRLTAAIFILLVIILALFFSLGSYRIPTPQPTPTHVPAIPSQPDVISDDQISASTASLWASACYTRGQCVIWRYYFYDTLDEGWTYIATRTDIGSTGTTSEYIVQSGHLRAKSEIEHIITTLQEFVAGGRHSQFLYYFVRNQQAPEKDFWQAISLQ
ncbi:hypothetical protein IJJ12_00660 [bacterium]|nr:hypothetical protein [bacterium]